MDLNRIYNNRGLECRRLSLLRRLRAQEVLKDAHAGSASLTRQVEIAFGSFAKQKKTPLSLWIADCAQQLDAVPRDAFRTMLLSVARLRSSMLDERRHIGAMSRLARYSSRWLDAPTEFSARSHNADRQFGELARFLLARWPVPKFFDDAWTERSTDAQREWFIHIGMGENLRTAPGLPFPLTKKMAHHALLAPDNVSIMSALRWGQVRALGGSERLARAIIATSLRDAQADEPFWLSVVQFFVANPMLDPHQVGPIVDWIHNQRFVGQPQHIVNGIARGGDIPQPNLSMKGRTVESVLVRVERWHRELNRARIKGATLWPTCGIPGYERIEGTEGAQKIVRIDEIVSSAQMQDEGRAMRHCVASYAYTCARGGAAIYSLKLDSGWGPERRLTIEVDVRQKRIVQARARFNAPPQQLDGRYLRAWATVAGLTIASY